MEITCKHGDTTCTPDWLCEACTYDWAEAEGRSDVIDKFNRGTVGMLGAVPSFRNGSGTGMGRGGSNGPSEKQIAFIEKLAREKGVEVPVVSTKTAASKAIDSLMALPTPVVEGAEVTGRWTKVGNDWAVRFAGGSSGDTVTVVKGNGDRQEVVLDQELTTGVWSTVKAPRPTKEVYEPGMYRRDDDKIVKVQENRAGTSVYGKVLNNGTGEWDYVPGALKNLTRLTVEEAKEYGHLTGRCCCCGRELTNETSIELGIGPVCLAKNF